MNRRANRFSLAEVVGLTKTQGNDAHMSIRECYRWLLLLRV
jgi:hypothetical protein